ncbi:glycosyltransferase family 39 protein [Variovorax sp. J31P179]|uniref:ArnT family glycosyltransferase n=1 Tax=Variovorax sp. J31P179 TaxID=3053508 RepID=UPI0025772B69|nr:glycosyltransferase family 39 protein [Variovorax sp. J31P179]MDM0081331.1 glycosyltransferase family 39 protein [Variovorax sp. J31P179]
MILLLPLCLALSYVLVWQRQGAKDRREALLLSAACFGAATVAVTEVLGALRLLDFTSVAAVWAILAVVLGSKVRASAAIDALRRPGIVVGVDAAERVMSAYVIGILILTAVLAACAPPNTWDSMTYHMSRVAHWVQNGSADFYPTAILRQLHSNPWAEFAILQAQLLSGGDRFANFVQWLCMAGALVGVSAISRQFGADRRAQIFTMVVCASIPMGILQATSTQTDYAVAFWLVCFAYFGVRIIQGSRQQAHFIGLSLSLGLAVLSKGTAYVFAFPFVLALGAWLLVRKEGRHIKAVALACALAFVLNLGHWSRNLSLYASPLGPGAETGGYRYSNDTFSTAVMVSNAVRNAGCTSARRRRSMVRCPRWSRAFTKSSAFRLTIPGPPT